MSKDANSDRSAKNLVTGIRLAAMNLLARREHCQQELRLKLGRRFAPHLIQPVLDQLVEEGLQSDRRFVEAFLQSRVARLQGPMRIRQELAQLQLPESMLDQALDNAEIDWLQRALQALQRRFQPSALSEPRERDRARQFLYRRGFPSELCVRAVEAFVSGSAD